MPGPKPDIRLISRDAEHGAQAQSQAKSQDDWENNRRFAKLRLRSSARNHSCANSYTTTNALASGQTSRRIQWTLYDAHGIQHG